MYEQFAQEISKLVESDRINIVLIDHEAATVTIRYQFGVIVPEYPVGTSLPLAGTKVEYVVVTGQSLRRDEMDQYDTFLTDRGPADAGLRSNITVPIIYQDCVIACLALFHHDPHRYGLQEQTLLEDLANLIAPVVENVWGTSRPALRNSK